MFGDSIKIKKETMDKLLDTVTIAIVSELDNCKQNIDVDKDGYISIKEMRIYVNTIIKILKSFVRGL